MRKATLLIVILCLGTSMLWASKPFYEKLDRYEAVQENTVKLELDFAGEIINNPDAIKTLKGKKIHHVDLVYTAYRESETFNQDQLNRNRKQRLMQLLPQVRADKPSWKMVEQSGAKSYGEAMKYFHGFVIHYGDDMNYAELTSFLKDFQSAEKTYSVSNEKGGEFKYTSGSHISIPANAVTYKDGTPVKGEFTLKYREFRDQADIAFSGIPMTYTQGGESFNFSSVGMYEVRAEQDGKELALQKPITIDFNCTKVDDGVGFYALNEATGEWVKKKNVEFDPKMESTVSAQKAKNNAADGDLLLVNKRPMEKDELVDGKWGWSYGDTWKDNNKKGTLRMSKNYWEYFKEEYDSSPGWKKYILEVDAENRTVWIDSDGWKKVQGFLNGMVFMMGDFDGSPRPNDMNSTLLAEGSSDPGHTYPRMVKGLNSPEFGVYNCDQIYRIGKAKSIAPKYVSQENGKEINDKHVACVIDLSYNGSFSFQPNNLTCNLEGKNAILLFTKDKRTYLLTPDQFASSGVEATSRPTFKMQDMTDQLKSSDDLRKLLNI